MKSALEFDAIKLLGYSGPLSYPSSGVIVGGHRRQGYSPQPALDV